MNAKLPKTVSEPTLKRLPLYHHFLKELLQREQGAVSCTDIGEELNLDPTQVRKDLEAAGISGRPRIGYATAAVVDGIERFLGWKKVSEAFLVGFSDFFYKLFARQFSHLWVLDVESILKIPDRMVLGGEQRIEIPERCVEHRAFHLFES